MTTESNDKDLLQLTSSIVAAHVAHNNVTVTDLPGLIREVYQTLATVGQVQPKEPERPAPAVPVKKSVTPDYIVCLEDGKKLKMLRRHLMTHYGMTPDDYRAKWGLPADYPMVAPNYAEKRRALAKEIGLGTKGRGGGRKRKAKV